VKELRDQIGHQARLRLLYLLTVADAIATGPAAWSTWKATLVSRLYSRVSLALDQSGDAPTDSTQVVHTRAEEIRAELKDDYPRIDEHLQGMPQAWLLSHSLSAQVEKSRLMMDFRPGDDLKLYPTSRSGSGVWELTVVARDRPGLFSKVSGSLALHGLNVVEAHAYTRRDGVALEVFRLEALGDEDHRFERVAEDIKKALSGRISLDMRLAEKRRNQPPRAGKGNGEPPKVVVDNNASDFYTVVEVHGPDQVGLLYTITRALSELELDIHLAKVSTYGDDVVDVFYVSDLEGRRITDPDYVLELNKTILHRVTGSV
jgi:[protein-PII] uridylyltransferase